MLSVGSGVARLRRRGGVHHLFGRRLPGKRRRRDPASKPFGYESQIRAELEPRPEACPKAEGPVQIPPPQPAESFSNAQPPPLRLDDADGVLIQRAPPSSWWHRKPALIVQPEEDLAGAPAVMRGTLHPNAAARQTSEHGHAALCREPRHLAHLRQAFRSVRRLPGRVPALSGMRRNYDLARRMTRRRLGRCPMPSPCAGAGRLATPPGASSGWPSLPNVSMTTTIGRRIRTEIYRDTSKTILTYNESPDVPMDVTIKLVPRLRARLNLLLRAGVSRVLRPLGGRGLREQAPGTPASPARTVRSS